MNWFKKLFTVPDHLFNPGAIVDRPDPRDYKWEEFSPNFKPFDWDIGYDVEVELRKRLNNPNFSLPVKDQGNTGSCGGQSWATYGSILEAMATGTFEERSAKFIYAQTYIRVPGGGSAGRDNCNLVKKQGWGLESLTPSYQNGVAPSEVFMERPQDITDAARLKASQATAISYVNTGVKIDDIAQSMAVNNGLILGISGINNGTWKNTIPLPPTYNQLNSGFAWRHWVYAGRANKLINSKKAIKIFNSWGQSTGDGGWQYLTEDYFNSGAVWMGWTLMFNKESVPAQIGFKHFFTIDMAYGDQNEEVRALQTALQSLGHFQMNPTGFYGSVTAKAVYDFQVKNGILTPDRNHAGPKTRGVLNMVFAN